MDCSEARAGLWPPERPRLVGDDVAAARAHVRECENCGAYFEQDRKLLDLYDRARRVSTPIAVRERVFDALARARWGIRRRKTGEDEEERSERYGHGSGEYGTRIAGASRWLGRTLLRRGAWPTAMVAALALVIVAEFRPGGQASADDPAMFVEDYLRRAVGQDHIDTNDPAEVTRFLQRELGMRVEPIRLSGLDIASVEICLLEGRRGAMIVYDKDGAEVTHYLVPREDAELRAPALSDPGQGESTLDMPVVTWSTPRIEQALVGEVDSKQLLEMASRSSVH
jgi:hypothetical protein